MADRPEITLDMALDMFEAKPNNANAALVLMNATKYSRDDMIDDETYEEYVLKIAHWLRDGTDTGKVKYAYSMLIDSPWIIAYYDAPDKLDGTKQVSVVGYWRDQLPPGFKTWSHFYSKTPRGFCVEGKPQRIVTGIKVAASIGSNDQVEYSVINPKHVFDYGQYKG